MNLNNDISNDYIILSDEIKRFANHLTYEINSPKKRREVREEYIEHIEDAIYHYTLKGMTPVEAFRKACEDIGDTQKIQTLLASVHNKDKIPRWVKYLFIAVISILCLSSPLFIINESFLAWYTLLLEITIFILFCVGIYNLGLFMRAVWIRKQAIKKLIAYAKRNGHTLTIHANPYLSLFRKTSKPEIIYETATQRYIMSTWATVGRKKTLHLTDFGFYSYSKNIGYFLICGFFGNVGAALNLHSRLPKDIKWWYWNHSEVVEGKPEGVRFMPQIEYESHRSLHKENIYVLLLNPIPFKIDFVENGVLHNGGDDIKFGDVMLWSASGFMSYMDGRMMYESKKFKSSIFND